MGHCAEKGAVFCRIYAPYTCRTVLLRPPGYGGGVAGQIPSLILPSDAEPYLNESSRDGYQATENEDLHRPRKSQTSKPRARHDRAYRGSRRALLDADRDIFRIHSRSQIAEGLGAP